MQEPQTLLLWPNGAPGAQGSEDRDKPAITVYMPPNTTGPMTAVIIAPGGSYQRLSMNLEGREPANYFNAMGIAAFVLRYRLGPQYHHPIELGDAQRAIRTVRARAGEWHIAPDRIGFMGFSAGGHLASSAATHFDAGNPTAADPIDRVSSTAGFFRARLPGDLVHRAVGASGIEDGAAGRKSGSRARAQPVERDAGDRADPASVHLPHDHGHHRSRRERGRLLPGAAQGRRCRRDARVQGRPAWIRPRLGRPGAFRVAADCSRTGCGAAGS